MIRWVIPPGCLSKDNQDEYLTTEGQFLRTASNAL